MLLANEKFLDEGFGPNRLEQRQQGRRCSKPLQSKGQGPDHPRWRRQDRSSRCVYVARDVADRPEDRRGAYLDSLSFRQGMLTGLSSAVLSLGRISGTPGVSGVVPMGAYSGNFTSSSRCLTSSTWASQMSVHSTHIGYKSMSGSTCSGATIATLLPVLTSCTDLEQSNAHGLDFLTRDDSAVPTSPSTITHLPSASG